MKEENQIRNSFDFENYLTRVDQENLKSLPQQQWARFIQKEIIENKIDIDNVYFSGNYASVYFKSINSFSPENLEKICLIHKKIWNQRKVPFFYVSTPTEIRAYNCFKPPIDPNKNIDDLKSLEFFRYSTSDTHEHLTNLLQLFNRVAIDTGKFWKDEKIAKQLEPKNRVDKTLIRNLQETRKLLINDGIEKSVVHDLLTRSLFVLYLDDIGATDANFYQNYEKNANSYFDLLDYKEPTCKFFDDLENSFNGNLFPVSNTEFEKINVNHLRLVKSCFWGEEVGSGQLTLWKMFDFSIIPIELLSEIYEIFLKKSDLAKSQTGEYYTPHSLVDFILNEILPWADDEHKDYNLKILDPACGSGIFLVEAFRRLVDRWLYSHKSKIDFKALNQILLNSIFGFEINRDAIKVASFSLYLALLSYLEPKTFWQEITFPYLIYDPENNKEDEQGDNLFLLSSLANSILKQPKFDLIIGNPPFKSAKTGSLEQEIKDYCKRFGFAQEMVLPFLHRANELCEHNGKIALLSTSKILFNKSGGYRKFREFLFENNYVETIINFSALRKPRKGQGKSIFANAVGPACVVFYRKERPKDHSDILTYCCPKPTVKDKYFDAVILDRLDFYYLPREECEKNDTTIWKIAMWGTERDFRLIKKLICKKSLVKFLSRKRGWYRGVGFKFLTLTKDKEYIDNEIHKFPIIEAKRLQRYTSKKSNLKNINKTLTKDNLDFYFRYYSVSNADLLPPINIFRGLGNKKTYDAPHLLIKEGQSNKELCASYLDFECTFKHTIYGISFEKKELTEDENDFKQNILKTLTAYLNSKLAAYFLFLTSISWGVERERITAKDLLELPAHPFEFSKEVISKFAKKFDEISFLILDEMLTTINQEKIRDLENELDELIFNNFDLSERERILIEDVLEFSIDLFQEGENSIAYNPVTNDDLKNYLEILCADINNTLQFSNVHVWSNLFEASLAIPLRMVALQFTMDHPAGFIQPVSSQHEIDSLITDIDRYTYEKHSESVYFRKVVKHYVDNTIYILKPNEKRFWSRSQAMQDADDITVEVANM